jgi:hypothetical protein
MRFRIAISLATLALSLFVCSAGAADEGTKEVLHVTSVKRDEATDWCTTGKCTATRYTVEGYRAAKNPNQVIRYLLECVEVVSIEEAKVTLACARVQADEDYDVKILADAIFFQLTETPKGGPFQSGYAIKSQREEKK